MRRGYCYITHIGGLFEKKRAGGGGYCCITHMEGTRKIYTIQGVVGNYYRTHVEVGG